MHWCTLVIQALGRVRQGIMSLGYINKEELKCMAECLPDVDSTHKLCCLLQSVSRVGLQLQNKSRSSALSGLSGNSEKAPSLTSFSKEYQQLLLVSKQEI